MKLARVAIAAVLLGSGLALPAAAVPLWIESVNGELPSTNLTPQQVSISSEGSYTLTGTTGFGDRDYIAVSLAPGLSLAALYLNNYVSSDQVAFIGMMSGTSFTESPSSPNVGNMLGWLHFGSALLGTDILDNICAGAGAIGCTPPLGGPAYSFWIQQLGSSTSYSMDFFVIPEPGTLLLAGLGLALLAVRRRSR
jgi:hypothetical protein